MGLFSSGVGNTVGAGVDGKLEGSDDGNCVVGRSVTVGIEVGSGDGTCDEVGAKDVVGEWEGLKLVVGPWLGLKLGSALGPGVTEGLNEGTLLGTLVGVRNSIPIGAGELDDGGEAIGFTAGGTGIIVSVAAAGPDNGVRSGAFVVSMPPATVSIISAEACDATK